MVSIPSSLMCKEKRVTGCEYLGEYLYFDKDGIVVESSSKHFMDILNQRTNV